jgi:transposase
MSVPKKSLYIPEFERGVREAQPIWSLMQNVAQAPYQTCKATKFLERAYQLSQEFVMMLAERREADLDPWLTQAERSGLPEFKKLAHGIRQDYAAVKAAFSSEWSNGKARGASQLLETKAPDGLREGEL